MQRLVNPPKRVRAEKRATSFPSSLQDEDLALAKVLQEQEQMFLRLR